MAGTIWPHVAMWKCKDGWDNMATCSYVEV